MPKANADYARLADSAEVLRDGYRVRTERAMAEINKLLKGHAEAVKVSQLIGHYAVQLRNELDASEQLERYVALRDRPPAKDGASDKV
jgi:hypothetical protein